MLRAEEAGGGGGSGAAAGRGCPGGAARQRGETGIGRDGAEGCRVWDAR